MSWLSKLLGLGDDQEPAESYKLSGGESRRTDAAFDAWTSGDLSLMLAALDTPTHPVDRHFLLQSIVAITYKERKRNPQMRQRCEQVARMHLTEFPDLVTPLLAQNKDSRGRGFLPRVSTFQHLATLLTEDNRFDEALQVCELALKYDLHDNTQGGFEKRIERIRKKQRDAT